ncbi:PREDICTED: protein SENESCENCE-ASSOCIATED GENE 21, mitochondrial-like [Tarenaya hassleriana]|uniref:protein SENESCENCE-ASSOCIATED GENE 21, mitochondrial-like n=1 Tax=Tarenaya hassleriana TaxID=28532 RepID=UPI00053C7D92|nr:PREDICTED: protein SENESCENCE-ASSOCIATED GENE 21, mitochondrial-like [Tarenaya hassleriana]
MAKSLSNVKSMSLCIYNAMVRRGYRAAANEAEAKAVRDGERKGTRGSREKPSSWAPDPKTGYYRPDPSANELVDAAELRASLLNQKHH